MHVNMLIYAESSRSHHWFDCKWVEWVQVVTSCGTCRQLSLLLHRAALLLFPPQACDFSLKSPFCHDHRTHFTSESHSSSMVCSQVKLLPSNLYALLPIPCAWKDGREIRQRSELPVTVGVQFAIYVVKLLQLCLTNSINHSSGKSIECIMAYITVIHLLFPFLSLSFKHTVLPQTNNSFNPDIAITQAVTVYLNSLASRGHGQVTVALECDYKYNFTLCCVFFSSICLWNYCSSVGRFPAETMKRGFPFYNMSNAKVRRRPHVVPEIAKHAAAEVDYIRALCPQSAGA